MEFDFDKLVDRYGTYCDKWDYLERYYGEKDMLGLWVADMDFPVPPAVAEAVTARAAHPIYGYTETDEDFYDGMIAWYEKRHGFHIEKEWITYTCGVIPAIAFLIQTFSEEGDKVIIQEPVYHPFKKTIVDNHRQPLINELVCEDGVYKMDLESLERQVDDRTKLMILCSPHNPVSRVWTREELEQVCEFCLRHHILLIADEIHCDIVFGDRKHTSIGTLDDRFVNNSIICNAPNKTFNIAGLQGSSIIIKDPELRRRYQEHMALFHLSGPTPITMAAFQAGYQHGGPWLDALLAYLAENIALVERRIREELPAVKVTRTEGTYMMWLDFRGTGLTMDEINDCLIHKAKVALNDGFMFGESGAGFQRMNIACPRSILQQALDRMIRAFGK